MAEKPAGGGNVVDIPLWPQRLSVGAGFLLFVLTPARRDKGENVSVPSGTPVNVFVDKTAFLSEDISAREEISFGGSSEMDRRQNGLPGQLEEKTNSVNVIDQRTVASMAELLTSLDVVNQSFKKSMRGYDPAEVDEFLDSVAETLQIYAQKNKDMERELETRSENLAEYEKTKSVLHEALLMAQKSADEKVMRAEAEAQKIMAEAMERADAMCGDAVREADRLREGIARIRNVRILFEQEFRGILAKFDNMLNQTMSNSAVNSAAESILEEAGILERPDGEGAQEEYGWEPEEERTIDRQDIENAFNALGVDPRTIMGDLEPERGN